MKKILVSICVIIIFVGYTVAQRHHSAATVTPTTTPASGGSSTATSGTTSTTHYKDGTYTGSVADAFYGNVQVSAMISGGKITAVNFLQSPHDSQNSIAVNQQAIPALQQEAIKAQTAHVNVVSGATQTSAAFVQSLAKALSQAT